MHCKGYDFDGSVGIITGAGAGVGAETARQLAAAGANVIVTGNNFDSCQKVAEEINESHPESTVAFNCDVSKRWDVHNLMKVISEKFWKIDFLVNNAGISEVDFIPKIKEHHWDRIMEVNAKGTFLMTQAVANFWIKHEVPGVIVNVVSESALNPHTMGCAYNASKAAQRAITKTSARELIKYGIRVNAVNPSIIEGTELTAYLNGEFKKEYNWSEEEAQKMYLSKIPAGRLCTVGDVAKSIMWLLSDDSEFVIGDDLMCSGGQAV